MVNPELGPADLLVDCAQSMVEGWTLQRVRDYGAACAAAQREQCAQICESMGAMEALDGEETGGAAMVRVADRMADLCAAAIRRA
jgi:hypothetical protein